MSQDNLMQHDEPRERDARFFVRAGWWLALLGAGSFFAWAALAPLDQGIAVQGTVVVSGKRKAVQSLGGGVVERDPGARGAGGPSGPATVPSRPDPAGG